MTATRLDGEDCALLTTTRHRCPDDGYEMALLNVCRIRCLSPSLGTSTYALQHACHENIPPQVSVLGFDERLLPIYVPLRHTLRSLFTGLKKYEHKIVYSISHHTIFMPCPTCLHMAWIF
jgi:hypothetical protein